VLDGLIPAPVVTDTTGGVAGAAVSVGMSGLIRVYSQIGSQQRMPFLAACLFGIDHTSCIPLAFAPALLAPPLRRKILRSEFVAAPACFIGHVSPRDMKCILSDAPVQPASGAPLRWRS
jgi:hypothetical protein